MAKRQIAAPANNGGADPLKIVTGVCRLSFAHLAQAKAFDESSPAKYSAIFLIPQDDHATLDKLESVIRDVYDMNSQSIFKGTAFNSRNFWNPLRDGDEYLEENPNREEYAGHFFVNAKASRQPNIYYADKQEMIDLEDIYSGCYVRGVLKAYAFNKNGKKGVGFFLNSVMKIDDGERFGGEGSGSPDEYDDEDYGQPAPRRSAAPARPAPRGRQYAEDDEDYGRPAPRRSAAPMPSNRRPATPAPRRGQQYHPEDEGNFDDIL